jgi:hypothetical protein
VHCRPTAGDRIIRSVTTDDCDLLTDAGPAPTWTLETLTADL